MHEVRVIHAKLELGPLRVTDWGEQGFTTRVSQSILKGRRRFEASFHSPGVVQIRRHLECHGCGFVSIADSGYDVWLPPRFRRIPASDGVTLAESSALTEVNPDFTKKIADGDFGDPYRGRVEPGWVLLARSGQTYGILGTAVLAGKHLEGLVVSDDVIRMKPHPEPAIRPGYLVTALSHPIFGRPLVKSLAYGSSIPHIDVTDIASFEVVRLKPDVESTVADLAERALEARVQADIEEREMANFIVDPEN